MKFINYLLLFSTYHLAFLPYNCCLSPNGPKEGGGLEEGVFKLHVKKIMIIITDQNIKHHCFFSSSSYYLSTFFNYCLYYIFSIFF